MGLKLNLYFKQTYWRINRCILFISVLGDNSYPDSSKRIYWEWTVLTRHSSTHFFSQLFFTHSKQWALISFCYFWRFSSSDYPFLTGWCLWDCFTGWFFLFAPFRNSSLPFHALSSCYRSLPLKSLILFTFLCRDVCKYLNINLYSAFFLVFIFLLLCTVSLHPEGCNHILMSVKPLPDCS